jgi:hypothetical protein
MARRTRKNNSNKNKKTRKQRGGRKLNGYMKFAASQRKAIVAANPSLRSDVVAVARKLGEKWRSMSDKEKARY